MGRQWLHAKREVAGLKKGQVTGKLVKEIMVAAKLGGADPSGNARLFAVVEKARRASVSRDVIERAIKKGAGIGGEKLPVVVSRGRKTFCVLWQVNSRNATRTCACVGLGVQGWRRRSKRSCFWSLLRGRAHLNSPAPKIRVLGLKFKFEICD